MRHIKTLQSIRRMDVGGTRKSCDPYDVWTLAAYEETAVYTTYGGRRYGVKRSNPGNMLLLCTQTFLQFLKTTSRYHTFSSLSFISWKPKIFSDVRRIFARGTERVEIRKDIIYV